MDEYYVYGRNAVRECVRSGAAKVIYALPRLSDDGVVIEAKKRGIEVRLADEGKLSKLSGNAKNQGLICLSVKPSPIALSELIKKASAKRYPLILILDGIEDPSNLGAILRSCDAFGVDGIVIKSHGNAPLNSTVAHVSTGAINYVPVCVLPNLSQALSELKDAGYWVVSSDGEAQTSYEEVDYHCPIALIVGSEGFGVSKLIIKRSDYIVKIPMVGHVNSLNASVATGILISHIHLARK